MFGLATKKVCEAPNTCSTDFPYELINDQEADKAFGPWMIARRARGRPIPQCTATGEQSKSESHPLDAENCFLLLDTPEVDLQANQNPTEIQGVAEPIGKSAIPAIERRSVQRPVGRKTHRSVVRSVEKGSGAHWKVKGGSYDREFAGEGRRFQTWGLFECRW